MNSTITIESAEESELGRIDWRKESIFSMTNRHLVSAIRALHFYRYKSEDQKETYSTLIAELNRRQNRGTI